MRRKEGVVNRHHFNKNAFFDFFLRRLSTRPTPGASCIPRRWRPLPTPAHPERLSSTGSSAGRARYTRADKYQCIPQPGRWTRCTGLHSIPDRPRRDNRTGRGRWTACALCPKLCRFGHSVAAQKNISFVNTFVAHATQNPFTVSQKCDIIMSQE